MRTLLGVTFVTLTAVTAAPAADSVSAARRFVELVANGDFAGAQSMMTADLASKIPSAMLQQIWQNVQKQVGAYQKVTGARTEASEKGDSVYLTLSFEKLTLDAKLPVDLAGKIAGFTMSQHVDYSPPDYVKTASFHEQDVMVGSGEWALHGTLTIPNGTIPNGDRPFPAVAMVAGSGPADRDSTLGPNKPFRDLAWGIASRGVVVLRYNKRPNEHGVEFSKLANMTVKEEEIDDALLAAALLRKTPGVDPKRVFVLGHSLGATLAPRIGKADPDIAGLIILGGIARPMVDDIVRQVRYNFELHGPLTTQQQKIVDTLAKQVARANDPNLSADTPKEELPMNTPASYWLDLRGYHPEQVARSLPQPLLVLQAERDYQVTMDDFAAWKKGLAGKTNVEFHSYPKLNHLFMEGEGPSSDEEYTKPGHVSGAVVEDIAAWIKRQ